MPLFKYYVWYYLDMVGTVVLLSAVFFVLETFAPAEKSQPLRKRLFNLVYYPLYLASVLFVSFVMQPAFAQLLQVTRGGILPRVIVQPHGFIGQLLFALVFVFVWDVWQYCVHRLQHTLPLLWETHKFHHSETALNSSTQARHHLTNALLFMVLHSPLLVIFGALSPHAIAAFLMSRLWGFVNHANLRLHLGPLTPVVAGPQWHRIHHSIHGEHRDKNFAAFFPFIDIMFGTYYKPQREEYPATGLAGAEPAGAGDVREATTEPILGIYRLARRRIGVANVLANLTERETVPVESGRVP
jgi:sterol desaturase/sphingolipid hydroxylase (fatty acid hydroxylase superfamily)